MNTGIVTVIQARSGSTRFPGKVFQPLCGEPLLVRMVERVLASEHRGTVIVATTEEPGDDKIATICAAHNWKCYRGSTQDLLDRHYQAALQIPETKAVIKIPSDCPLIDYRIIDEVIAVYLEHQHAVDFVSNLHPATHPDGNDVEIMSMQALETAWKEAARPLEREHTTPYIWEHPEKFRMLNVTWNTGLNYSMSHRFTIDYPEDYAFIQAVYEVLFPENPRFSLSDILNLLEKHPEIYALNARYAGVNWYRNHLNELKTIDPSQTKEL